ncbi:MAG: methyltransferase [Alphaproteobacteria bacterium]|nr:methyltransferase [Alphaproteobacteria bacterium]
MLIEYHRTMLADKARNDAFYEALKRVIKPGETSVADIGCGTGLLGFMAAKLGAKQVYMYEQASIGAVAFQLAKDNKIKNVKFFEGSSLEDDNPPQVDVVVSETLGNYAFEEHIIQTLNDARQRFLKADGVIMPQGVKQFVAPVVTRRLYNELAVWDRVGYGLNFDLCKTMSMNNIYVRSFNESDLLEAQQWDAVTFDKENTSNRKGNAAWTAAQDLTVYGFAVWWECELVNGISISTGPASPVTHWEQLYFPVEKPVDVKQGEKFTCTLSSQTTPETGSIIKWQLEHKGTRQNMTLEKGYLD